MHTDMIMKFLVFCLSR